MFYKLIAFVILILTVVLPLGGIVWLAVNFTPVWWGYIALHFMILRGLYLWIKSIDLNEYSTSRTGANETMGASEDVIAVIKRKR